MTTASTFKLESLSYQADAVQAMVDVFKGQSLPDTHALTGNRCKLTWEQLSANLQAIALRHRISDERLNLTPPEQGQPLDVCVEMETGTGKTLVYLRKLLLCAYRGQVKCIYIDPPYNTGNDFVYKDNFAEGQQAFIAEKEASLFNTLDALAVRDEVLLKCGFQLDVQLTPIAEVTANQLYRAYDQQTPPREAIVCFDGQLDTTTLEWLRQQKGQRVIVLEAALDTTGKWNLHHQLGDGLVVY